MGRRVIKRRGTFMSTIRRPTPDSNVRPGLDDASLRSWSRPPLVHLDLRSGTESLPLLDVRVPTGNPKEYCSAVRCYWSWAVECLESFGADSDVVAFARRRSVDGHPFLDGLPPGTHPLMVVLWRLNNRDLPLAMFDGCASTTGECDPETDDKDEERRIEDWLVVASVVGRLSGGERCFDCDLVGTACCFEWPGSPPPLEPCMRSMTIAAPMGGDASHVLHLLELGWPTPAGSVQEDAVAAPCHCPCGCFGCEKSRHGKPPGSVCGG